MKATKNRKSRIGIVILMVLALSVPVLTAISKKLSKTAPVDANILLVEGWMRPYAIEVATSEFNKNHYQKIITTGLKTAEYFNEAMNGYMIFYTGERLKKDVSSSKHIIEVSAFSEMDGENSAHFRLFINDSASGDMLADKHKRKYAFTWEGSLSSIDSIMVQFDNDKHWDSGDRNLYLKELIIDHRYSIPYYSNSVYEIRFRDRKARFLINYNSYAELAKERFIYGGIDSSVVIAVPGERVRINRTLTSALAFRNWAEHSGIQITGINIVSSGPHAYRTWYTYNKVLKAKYKIGIISVPDFSLNNSFLKEMIKTARESIALIYYWLILIPY